MELFASTPHQGYDERFSVFLLTKQPKPPSPIISKEVKHICLMVNLVVVSSLIALFGIFANGINIIVFYRQGFTTTTNISFFALAISDMLCLVPMVMLTIFLNPYLDTDDMPYLFKEIEYLAVAWLSVCAGRITSWITVFITAERCLGVALPLKVKQIVTRRRTTISMCIIFVVNLWMLVPEYSIAYLDWKFVPAKNRTVFGLVYRSNTENVYGLVFTLTSVSEITSFIFVILLTTFLVTSLERKSKWRQKAAAGSDNSETVSSRDKKTMKMIIMIASVLIVCYIPGTTITLAATFVPEFMIDRAYENSFLTFWTIGDISNSINSSINVFIYYRMSTKYRQTFNELFSRCIKMKYQQPTS